MHRKIRLKTYIMKAAGFLFLSMISAGFAQTGIRFSNTTVLDGNAFKNYENLSDIIYQPRLSLFHELSNEKGGIQFFYNGSAFLFTEFSARQYYYHNIGFSGQRWSDDGMRTLSWGLQGGQRFNKADYQYYDYQHADAYMNFQVDTQKGRIWMLGAQVRYRRNIELTEFNFLETLAFIRGSFFLKTRTTIMGRFQAGYKTFTESLINDEWVESFTGTGQMGRGKGRGIGDGTDSTYYNVVHVVSPQNSVFQLTGALRLAQSLGAKTGCAVEYTMQRNLDGGSRVLSGQDSGYETNDELFDDPYSYDMNDLSLELTQLLPWQSRLKIDAMFGRKKYSRPVYDLDGVVVEGLKREDTLRILGATLSKTISFKAIGKSMVLTLNYMYIYNNSNDDYYYYKSGMTRLGCEFTF
ncbi:hypothetical protein KAR48_02065 [bacterium]|nr:hypothetical protein [bacterium]